LGLIKVIVLEFATAGKGVMINVAGWIRGEVVGVLRLEGVGDVELAVLLVVDDAVGLIEGVASVIGVVIIGLL
jgi:hypothetical protein